MKKIICILLAVLMCISFAACGKKGGSGTQNGDTFDLVAAKGQIPELSIKLGTMPNEAISFYRKEAEDKDNVDLELISTVGENTVNLSNGETHFCYERKHEQFGISFIALTNGTAFSLEIANTPTKNDVEAKFSKNGTAAAATADQLFFMPGFSDGFEVISYNFDNIVLEFFFYDDFLTAVAMKNTTYWTA